MARPTRQTQIAEQLDDTCQEKIVHVAAVRTARSARLSPNKLDRVSALFAALSDPTRLRIVRALQTSELCVCDIAATVGISESAVSHQLRLLRETGLVRNRRDGRLVLYALDDDHVTQLVALAIDHASHATEGSVR